MKHFRPGRWSRQDVLQRGVAAISACHALAHRREPTHADTCINMRIFRLLFPKSQDLISRANCLSRRALPKHLFCNAGSRRALGEVCVRVKKREARPCQPRAPYNTTSKSDKCCAGPIFDVRDGVEEPAWRDIFSLATQAKS